MFTIKDGRTALNQWEQGQVLVNPCMVAGDRVIFHGASGKSCVMYATADGVEVPNILLQTASPMTVDLYGSPGCRTRICVNHAEKPTGYVFVDNVKTPEPQTGGGSGVDVTAAPGQTIVVEEVDANGKPTKWKAVNMPVEEYINPTTDYNTNLYLVGAFNRSGRQRPATYLGAYMDSYGTLYSKGKKVLTVDDLEKPITLQTDSVTPAEIMAAAQEGKTVFIAHVDASIGAYVFSSSAFVFDYMNNVTIANTIVVNNGVPTLIILTGDMNANTWQMIATPLSTQ